MRPVTKRVTLGILTVLAMLLALGAVPSLLRAGDPYYLTATAAEAPEGVDPVNVSNLSAQQYRYTFAALEADDGRSDAYYRGPLGVKGAFTHSPFDEVGAYEAQYPGAVEGDVAYVRVGNTTYRLEVVQG